MRIFFICSEAARKAALPNGSRPGTIKITSSAMRLSTVLASPVVLARIQVSIKFRMEQQGLTVDDLATVIGRKNRVYEILNRTRPLTLRMIEGLHRAFGIPAESLLKQGVRGHAKAA